MQKEIKDSIILIIEDNQTQQNIMQVFLKNYGFNFISAFNGVEAFKILDSILPDLILLDIMLPGMDGFEICTKLKENNRTKDIPVIFITALRNENDIIKGLKLGGSDYLGKPFNQEELVARVRTHLNLKLYRDQIIEKNFKLEEEILKQEKYKKALRLSDEKFKKAFHLNPNPSVLANYTDQKYIEVNNAFLAFTGYSKEEIIGKASDEFFLFNDLEQRKIVFEIFDKAGAIHNYELKIRSKSSNIYDVLLSMEQIVINDELCYISIITDISDIKHLKETLDNQTEVLKRISTLNSDIAFKIYMQPDYSISTKLLFGSFDKLTGYTPDELSEYGSYQEVLKAKSDFDLMKLFDKLKSNTYIEEIFSFLHKDGSKIWIKLCLEVIDYSDEKLSAFAFCKDITEITNIEKALIQSENKYKQLTENTNCLIGEMNSQGQFLYANDGYKKILGYEPIELIGNSFFDILHCQDKGQVQSKCHALIENNLSQECTARIMTKSGDFRWFSCSGNIIVNESTTKIVFVCVEVSARIQLEDELKQKLVKLKELNNTKDKFFSIIAHDLKGPVSSFNSVLSNLQNYYKDLSKEELEVYINSLNTSTTHLFSLLEDLLDWSRTQTGNFPFHPERFPIKYVIDNIISLNDLSASSKDLTIVNDVEDDCIVFADVKMVSTIIRNLISNAVKFSNTNGIITISSEIIIDNDKEYASISVIDNGIGISEECIAKLFIIDKCYTSDGTFNEKGTGLGLLLCKEFAEHNGGKIFVKSEIGSGTTFTFTLPLE